jgi:class 3 adenylate cyclase
LNPADNAFCEGCGHRLVQEAPIVSPPPGSYTPRHLAEKILSSRRALEGERKQVTVLFVDVKSSVELSEAAGPERWHRILDRLFAILAEGVHRFEGTVNQYTGDGIMALFGAPLAHEDHGPRACYAGLYLVDALRRYADELRGEGLDLGVRMGLNSGEVVVGKIGDDLRMDYTALGTTVGLAARMQELADPWSPRMTEHTARLVEGLFRLRDLGPMQPRGVGRSVRVYELEGAAARSRLDAGRARGFSRFVGRDDEMAALESALRRASRGRGQVVGVVGDAGVGKSRLCLEFAERCRSQGVEVHVAHCAAPGKAAPLDLLAELLRSVLGLPEGDSEDIARERVVGRLALLGRGSEEAVSLVLDLFGIAADRPPPALKGAERARRLAEVVTHMLRAPRPSGSVVVLIDDLQWIDPQSEEVIDRVIEGVGGSAILVIVNFRPGHRASFVRESCYQQVPLVPLDPAATDDLLAYLLGTDPGLADLKRRIRERTCGNPFFVEETVRSLAESGALLGAPGAYRQAGPVEELVIPATVEALLSARIDRLPERERQVLRTASVIGTAVSRSVLGRVLALEEGELSASLAALREARFVHETALYPEAEYGFGHPLTREVAYHSLLHEQRARLHGAVARALEDLYADRLGDKAALIARHWEAADEPRAAALWRQRAALRVSHIQIKGRRTSETGH